jgi:hypothetical protein
MLNRADREGDNYTGTPEWGRWSQGILAPFILFSPSHLSPSLRMVVDRQLPEHETCAHPIRQKSDRPRTEGWGWLSHVQTDRETQTQTQTLCRHRHTHIAPCWGLGGQPPHLLMTLGLQLRLFGDQQGSENSDPAMGTVAPSDPPPSLPVNVCVCICACVYWCVCVLKVRTHCQTTHQPGTNSSSCTSYLATSKTCYQHKKIIEKNE